MRGGKADITKTYLQPYIGNVLLYFLLTCMATVFSIASILSISNFLQILFGESSQTVGDPSALEAFLNRIYFYFMQFGRRNALWIFALLLFGIYLLKDLFTYLASYFVASTRYKIVRNIRRDLFAAYSRADVAFLSRYRKGDLLSRISGDVIEYDQNVLQGLQSFVSVVINIVLHFAILLYLNWSLTLTTLLVLPLAGGVVSLVSRKLRHSSRAMQSCSAELISRLEETISGLRIIKSHTAIEFMCNSFARFNDEYTRLRTRIYRRVDLASPQSEFFGNCMVIAILLLGTTYIVGDAPSMSAEIFIVYLIIFSLLVKPAKDFSTALYNIRKGTAAKERISEIVLAKETTESGQPTRVLPERIGRIEFRGVCFSYGDKPTLRNIDAVFEKGVPTAVVGPSGAGKSTLTDLLLKFYAPTKGEILLDGVSLRQASGSEARKHMAIVAQDTVLFNDTISENLTFGTESYSREQIIAAAKAAMADEFIEKLSQGYDTVIGDGGCTLSGGQKQRMAIARALLRNPDVLVLDEATSALDTISERYVRDALEKISRERIVITIAHRLSTIRDYPNILVLDRGEIVERGSHQSLIAKGGLYAGLCRAQNLTA